MGCEIILAAIFSLGAFALLGWAMKEKAPQNTPYAMVIVGLLLCGIALLSDAVKR
jgi:hypothetical protein